MKKATLLFLIFLSCAVRAQNRPLIGITTGYSSGVSSVGRSYGDAVLRAGGIPVLLPPVPDQAAADKVLGAIDGVIFTGGEDIDPVRYGEKVYNGTVEVNGPRDTLDFLYARAACDRKMPVLGICRGAQLLCVALGGTLYQDLPAQKPGQVVHMQKEHATVPTHKIVLARNSRLHQLMKTDTLEVNSFHHQAAKDLPEGVRASALSEDGVVEGFEDLADGRFLLAVQFHPELLVQTDPKWLSIFSCLVAQARRTDPASLAKSFAEPPQSARPYLWWHWMDGEVSKEGIDKDLAWMKRSGIGGFHQFDAGGVNMPRTGTKNLPYFSEGWKDAFRHALHEADSLGFEVAVASAPGWSSTGGPWVKPEDAMKKLEWRTLDVKGGRVSVKLPALYNQVGPYQDDARPSAITGTDGHAEDVALVAVKLPARERSMEEMGARLTCSDTVITCDFPKPQTVKALTLRTSATGWRKREGEQPFRNVVETSPDGKSWTEISKVLLSPLPYVTFNIPATTTRHLRVRGSGLRSLEVHPVFRVENAQEMGGFAFQFDFNRHHTPETGDAVRTVLDLTGKLSSDGTLACTLPPGRWRIYRFASSLTGKTNHPASPDATGFEVDKLDPQAWMRYFRNYVDVYKEAAGGLLGQRGIRCLLTDSYEAGTMTWTRNMVQEFKARRGYDLIPWLPVLTGEIIGSSVESERFLWDWRMTMGELFAENYDRINRIVEEYGMEGRYTESHEGGRAFTGDGMDIKRTAMVPMSAIWMENTVTGSRVAQAVADIRESASVAHLFGQNLVAAESFTANGDGRRAYTYCPENLKYIADVALGAGLNRFVIHESAAQPVDDYLPGLGLFKYGQWFNRNETWAEYAGVWTDYLARSCHLLQQGHAVADILLYYGEDQNVTALYGGETLSALPQIPQGYEYDFANPCALLEGVEVRKGRLVTPSGMDYKVLLLGEGCEIMSTKILRRLRELADSGVVICGEPPRRSAGRQDSEKEFSSLVKSIWQSGRSHVTQDLGAALDLAGTAPDFSCDVPGIRYVHRSTRDGSEIYWVRNFSPEDRRAKMSFRTRRAHARVFNPENGRVERVACRQEDGRTVVELDLLTADARFVVLSDEASDAPALRKPVPERILEIAGGWEVEFHQRGGGDARETFPSLISWTASRNPVVKYYAGTATYRTTFSVPPGRGEVLLDLGCVKNIAEVFVNGQRAGVLWKAPFRTDDIRALLNEGENTLEVKVTNLWVNRMIGDCEPDVGKPVTKVRRFYKAGDPLLPSGLLGPVKMIECK